MYFQVETDMKKTDMNLSQVDHQGSLKLQELQV